MTTKEKIDLATRIRSSNFCEPTYDREYLKYLNEVDIKESSVDTAGGMCKVYIHKAKDFINGGALFINVHGGGFVRPHMPGNTYFSAEVAAKLHSIVVDVDYKLAPEYPYPTALNEVYGVLQFCIAHAEEWGCNPAKTTICGHSAGASLSLASCIRAKLLNEAEPKLMILDFGAYDMAIDPANRPGAANNAISSERMKAFTYLYTNDDNAVIYSPYVSPVYAPDELFYELPDTLMITAAKDALRFESERLGLKMAAQGVEVTMQRIADSDHGFVIHCTGNWQQAHTLIINTVKAL